MKKRKKLIAILVLTIALIAIAITASAGTTLIDGGMLEDDGFYYSETGKCNYYAYIYTPDGTLLHEGYLESYTYNDGWGIAHLYFEDDPTVVYYAHPSNFYWVIKKR